MKLTLKRDEIISGVKSVIEEAISNDELSITEVSDLEPEYTPQVVIDYMKENFKSKIITLGDNFTTQYAFALDLFWRNLRYPYLYAERLFDEIFKNLSTKFSGTIKNFDKDGDDCNYQVNDYYAFLDLSDASSGGTCEYILQIDDNGDLILPKFDEITIKVEKEDILDTPETRKWMLDNLDKEV